MTTDPMNIAPHPDDAAIAEAFKVTMGRHGNPLQHAIMRTLAEAGSLSRLRLLSWEFPVEVRGKGTRIDIVMGGPDRLLLVAECKRANPSYKDWFFAASPTMRVNDSNLHIVAEYLFYTPGKLFAQGMKFPMMPMPVADVGIELKGKERGDPEPKSGTGIEDACSQVSMHLGGMVDFLAHGKHAHIANSCCPCVILPVVFTTARMWWSDVDISQASLETGMLADAGKIREVPYVCFQYPLSPGIKHLTTARDAITSISNAYASYLRSIVFVKASRAHEFFCNFDFRSDAMRTVEGHEFK